LHPTFLPSPIGCGLPSPPVFYMTEGYKCQHILQSARPFSEHQLRGGLHAEINSRNPDSVFWSVLQVWCAHLYSITSLTWEYQTNVGTLPCEQATGECGCNCV